MGSGFGLGDAVADTAEAAKSANRAAERATMASVAEAEGAGLETPEKGRELQLKSP